MDEDDASHGITRGQISRRSQSSSWPSSASASQPQQFEMLLGRLSDAIDRLENLAEERKETKGLTRSMSPESISSRPVQDGIPSTGPCTGVNAKYMPSSPVHEGPQQKDFEIPFEQMQDAAPARSSFKTRVTIPELPSDSHAFQKSGSNQVDHDITLQSGQDSILTMPKKVSLPRGLGTGASVKAHRTDDETDENHNNFSETMSDSAEHVQTGDKLAAGGKPHQVRLFADKDALKEYYRQRMGTFTDEEMTRLSMFKKRGIPAAIVKHEAFELFSLALVCLNGLWIAIDLDVTKSGSSSPMETHPIALLIENFFCVYFLAEWCLKVAALRTMRSFTKDSWFVLDLVLLVPMVLDTWGLLIFYAVNPERSAPTFLTAPQSLRAIRILRITRIGRAMRLFRYAPELLYLVHGMVSATRSVAYSMGLLFLILYIFALFFRVTSEGFEFGEQYFASVPHAVLSLGIYGALLDGPSELVQKMQDEGAYVNMVFFFLVIFLTALTLMNMLIGVLCDVVTTVSSAEKEACFEHYMREILVNVFNTMDSDSDSQVTKDEFIKGLRDPKIIDALDELQVDIFTLIDYAELLFQSDLSGNNFDQVLSLKSFITCIVQLRGDSPAKVRDIVEQRKLFHKTATETHNLIIGLASNQQQLERHNIRHQKNSKAIGAKLSHHITELDVQVKQLAAHLKDLPHLQSQHLGSNEFVLKGEVDAACGALEDLQGNVLNGDSSAFKPSNCEIIEDLREQPSSRELTEDLRAQLSALVPRIEGLEDRAQEEYEAGIMQGIKVGQEWEHEHTEAAERKRFAGFFFV